MQPGGSAPREQSSWLTVLLSNHVAYCSLLYSLLAVMRRHSWFCGLIVWPHCLPRPEGSCTWLFGRGWTWHPQVGCHHGRSQAILGGSWSHIPGMRNIPRSQILTWPHCHWCKWVSCCPLGQMDDSRPIPDCASCSHCSLFSSSPAMHLGPWFHGPFVWPTCLPWSRIPSIFISSCNDREGGEAQVDGVGNVGALISRESCSVCYPNQPQNLYEIEPHCTRSSVGLQGWHARGASKTHTTKEIDRMELNWITRPWKWFAHLLRAMLSMFLDNWASLTLQGPSSQLGECLQILPCFVWEKVVFTDSNVNCSIFCSFFSK